MNSKANTVRKRSTRVLSIDPRIDRLGIAWFDRGKLLDAKSKPIEYGVIKRLGHQYLVGILMRYVEAFEPEVLLLPEMRSSGVRGRSGYIAEGVQAVTRQGFERDVTVYAIAYRQVLAAFPEAGQPPLKNRHELHKAIVERFPELTTFMPRARRIYDPERYYTPLFHAVAMYCAWRQMT